MVVETIKLHKGGFLYLLFDNRIVSTPVCWWN